MGTGTNSVKAQKEDDYDLWEALVHRASDLEGGVTRNASPSAIELVEVPEPVAAPGQVLIDVHVAGVTFP